MNAMWDLTSEQQAVLTPDTNLLVSGATGLIGGELLREWRRLSGGGTGHTWALVRPRDGASPAERLGRRLARGAGAAASAPVEALAGDMTLPDWGLSPADLGRVTESVDVIIHNAADTSYLAQRTTRETNVSGARRLIALARKCRRNPLIVFMSTAANSGEVKDRVLTEGDGCRPDNPHINDYTYSKAIAELMLRESGLPVLTLRPSIVLPAGRDDPALARQILWFAPLTNRFEALPIDPVARLDVVDVDFVVNATLGLLSKPGRRWDTYNLSAGPRQAITTAQGLSAIARHYRREQPLRLVPPEQWGDWHAEAFVRSPLQKRLFAEMSHYFRFLNQNVVQDDARLRHELGGQTPRVRPVQEYLPGLLAVVPDRIARREALRA
jgi:nucleoside-diphosphate-sugar epimerase